MVHGVELVRSEREKLMPNDLVADFQWRVVFMGEKLLLCDAMEPGMLVLAVTSIVTPVVRPSLYLSHSFY